MEIVLISPYTIGVKILIMGAGTSGAGTEAAEYYLKFGNKVSILAEKGAEGSPMMASLREKGAMLISRSEAEKEAAVSDIVVKMPGVPIPYSIKKNAKCIMNDIAALLTDPSTETMKKIVILGAKGKTSTASALTDALSRLGIRAVFSEGGLGYSAFHILSDIENDNRTYDAVIIEMSQRQIRDTAESLNYQWPRLDIIAITDQIPLPSSPADPADGGLIIGPWARKMIIPRPLKDKILFSGIIPRAKVKTYPSILNPYKSKAGSELAWECLRALGFGYGESKNAFHGYKGIPNRLELVSVVNGISFINDSSSVIPLSVRFSMKGMRGTPVHLIVGGTDKMKAGLDELAGPLDDAVSITLLSGSLTDRIIQYLRHNGIRFTGPFDKMEDAVDAAYKAALAHQRGRDASEIILLSPGSYADEHFANEFERGRIFRNCAMKIASGKT